MRACVGPVICGASVGIERGLKRQLTLQAVDGGSNVVRIGRRGVGSVRWIDPSDDYQLRSDAPRVLLFEWT